MPKNTSHIRASMLPSYADCARRTVGRIIKARDFPPHKERIATLFGTIMHAVIKARVENSEDEKFNVRDEIVRQFEVSKALLKYGIAWDKYTTGINDVIVQGIRVYDKLKLSGLDGMIENGVEFCEQQFHTSLYDLIPEYATDANGDPCPIKKAFYEIITVSGTADLITKRGTLIDWKTGRYEKYFSPQLALYGMLAEQQGIAMRKLCHYWIKRTDGELRVFIYDYQSERQLAINILMRMAADVNRLAGIDDVSEGKKIILLDVIPNPSSFLCSEDFCELHNTEFCAYGRKGEPVNV